MRKILKTVLSVIIVIALSFVCLFFFSDSEFPEVSDIIEKIILLNDDVDIDFEEEFGTKTMYYYNRLTESEKKEYLKLYVAVRDFQEKCELNLNANRLSTVYTSVNYDNPELFWMGNKHSCSSFGDGTVVYFKYDVDETEARETKAALDQKVDEIVAEASKYSTDYQKEKFLHDYICRNVVYDESTFGTTGGLVSQTLLNGSAICEGYAKAMQLLLNEVGIENYLVLGEDASKNTQTECHMWNVVKIDGKNYHLDVTWDDFEDGDSFCYMYFNVTDADISGDHKNIEPSDNNCISYDANYFYMNGTFLQSFDGFDSLIHPTVNMLKSGSVNVEFRFADKDDYNKAVATIKNDNNGFFTYVGNCVTESGRNLSKSSINYFTIDSLNYLCIIFVDG